MTSLSHDNRYEFVVLCIILHGIYYKYTLHSTFNTTVLYRFFSSRKRVHNIDRQISNFLFFWRHYDVTTLVKKISSIYDTPQMIIFKMSDHSTLYISYSVPKISLKSCTTEIFMELDQREHCFLDSEFSRFWPNSYLYVYRTNWNCEFLIPSFRSIFFEPSGVSWLVLSRSLLEHRRSWHHRSGLVLPCGLASPLINLLITKLSFCSVINILFDY